MALEQGPVHASQPRILIVEDEPFIALSLEETLQEVGFEIAGPISHVSDALNFLAREHVDVALLDVNIGLHKVDPVADALAALNIPFVFITGYGRSGLPSAHANRTVLEKPFKTADLLAVVGAQLEGSVWTRLTVD